MAEPASSEPATTPSATNWACRLPVGETTTNIDGYPVIRATAEMISKYGSCKMLVGVADDAAWRSQHWDNAER